MGLLFDALTGSLGAGMLGDNGVAQADGVGPAASVIESLLVAAHQTLQVHAGGKTVSVRRSASMQVQEMRLCLVDESFKI